jgi:septal ring factor EnvC (AmiA/AmiB activator)
MTKYLTAILAAVILALSGWVFYERHRVSRLQADVESQQLTIQNQNTAILSHQEKAKRDTATLKDMAKRQAALTVKQKESTNALSKAIGAAPDWADTPLPDSIIDWVRK